MNPILHSALLLVAAIVLGSCVNFALVILGPMLIPPPPGVDMSDMESFAAAIDQMGPLHFLFPFLAHALGTLSACLLCAKYTSTRKHLLTYSIAVFFLFGGISAATMIPAPMWFVIVDLLFAYLPMAWLATKIFPTNEAKQ